MTWSIFRSKSRQSASASERSSGVRRTDKTALNLSPGVTANGRRAVIPVIERSRRLIEAPPRNSTSRGILDPESNPMVSTHSTAPQILSSSQTNQTATAATGATIPSKTRIKKKSSLHSVRSSSGRSESGRSVRSAVGSVRARQIKAAHSAKRAAAHYIASNSEQPLHCFCCGHQLTEVKCPVCRTSYLAPDYKFSSSTAAITLMNEAPANGNVPADLWGAISSSKKNESSAASISSVSISNLSISTNSITGATSFIGFYPENDFDDDEFDQSSPLDFELVSDLAALQEATLLEAILFDCFSSLESIANTFYRQSSPDKPLEELFKSSRSQDTLCLNGGEDAVKSRFCATPGFVASEQETRDEPHLIVDTVAVNKLYEALANVNSSAPMRGILRGAQCILQTRRHAPLTELEVAYICIILQCPAITDCSMFTKITGPLQKLSRYASLRSRARTILEVCSGLIVNSEERFHYHFCQVFASLDETKLEQIVDLCNSYVSHRLSYAFHVQARQSNTPGRYHPVKYEWYADDWRMNVVVRLLALLWEANKIRENDSTSSSLPAQRFYNTMVDFVELKADFDAWQTSRSRKQGRFCFCKYPFMLSMGSKATVFEHSVQRVIYMAFQKSLFDQMAINRRGRTSNPHIVPQRNFVLQVRRQHLLEDSVEKLKDWQNNKRGNFKVEFEGEPGVDAGGLKKEWFLMFFKQLFAPELGAFIMDESSNYCWFGNNENIKYYAAAGSALGLALFNRSTVDLSLPPLLFKLLLDYKYDLNDVGKLWPDIAQSLQSILDYEHEDFAEAFGMTFTAPDGTELIADGENMVVNLANKEVFVTLLVEHLVNESGRPFQAFKAAFREICAGNTLTLFQPEELESLIIGDRKQIDINTLRSITRYVNFGHRYEKANVEPVVIWFWDYFEKLDPTEQAQLLQFVTATDRPPAAGPAQMRFSIMCLGPDSDRLPIAHTCFNQLGLYRYKSRRKLERKLSLAMAEYQGFGLK